MQMHFIMKNLALCNRDNHCVVSPGKTAKLRQGCSEWFSAGAIFQGRLLHALGKWAHSALITGQLNTGPKSPWFDFRQLPSGSCPGLGLRGEQVTRDVYRRPSPRRRIGFECLALIHGARKERGIKQRLAWWRGREARCSCHSLLYAYCMVFP